MQQLRSIKFKNEFTNNFVGDESGSTMPRQTPDVFYSKVLPTPVNLVKLLAWSNALGDDLGIQKPVDQIDVDLYGGNAITSTMNPYAACYAGHQFGNWAGQLGDGRAITLAEMIAPSGKSWELQLKGAGPTPYSRRADGRAVLRSSVREYLMSEAMHYLGIPTTRALSLVSTGEQVMRDMFYNGNAAFEQGAIVMRVAPSFLRFGNFEILAARKEIVNLQKLVDWTIEKFYPHISGEEKVLTWFNEVIERTANLVVQWQRVGFVHGVMNTDNMSILGLTIDYGPYSFLDDYDLNFTPNTTDLPGRRYAFGRQPAVGKWNLSCLAGAIAPLFANQEVLVNALETYDDTYWSSYYKMMGDKLGFDELGNNDIAFIKQFENVLSTIKPDLTIFYQLLIDMPHQKSKEEIIKHFSASFYEELAEDMQNSFYTLMFDYEKRIAANSIDKQKSREKMRAANPRFILRNYLLHKSIEDLEKGDITLFEKLQQAMKDPYGNKFDDFFVKRPSWASNKAGCSMLSCSS